MLPINGEAERKLEEGIKPLENCQFVSSRVLRAVDKVYSLLGERCKASLSAWRVLRTDFAGGNSINLASGPTGAGGGALYDVDSSPDILDSQFLNNSTTDFGNGGAILNQGSDPTIVNCLFVGNVAGQPALISGVPALP